MLVLEIFVWLLFVMGVVVVSLALFVYWIFSRMFDSIQPTSRWISANNSPEHDRNPLFRHIPTLRKELAWEELGEFPTPIHRVQLLKNGQWIRFYMKREDLCSRIYGGNKVRTLQYQIPSCVQHSQLQPGSGIHVTGSGGSNQVVATLAHGALFGLKFSVVYPMGDAPEMDNTLNLLSTLSLGPTSVGTWDKMLSQVYSLIRILSSGKDKIFGDGGNSIGGILGQMGGALELAEQIMAGEVPDPDEIYLPMGSSCTTAGLILGVCLARYLGLEAFRSKRFKIVSVCILGDYCKLNRWTGLMTSRFAKYFPMAPRFGIHRTVTYFKNITGIDLLKSSSKFLEEEWEFVGKEEYAGEYGAHSARSAAASAWDEKLEVSGRCPSWFGNSQPPLPWLCGHFSGKAFAVMLDRMETAEEPLNVLFWQTKSYVQPLGKEDEWEHLVEMAAKSRVLKKWVNEGKSTSVLRQGKINLDSGSPSDYRHLMTKLE